MMLFIFCAILVVFSEHFSPCLSAIALEADETSFILLKFIDIAYGHFTRLQYAPWKMGVSKKRRFFSDDERRKILMLDKIS